MNTNKITNWLFVCAASVFMMALIGAITRLTESGLSIVEWKPVTGALPPLNHAAWEHEFQLYQQSPQYQKINFGMTLDEFKNIFFWEWLHRLWGRLIGVIYAVPLVWFWLKGQIPQERKKHFIGILLLGLAQGVMGWYMVKSGLVDQPSVSHYRLAAHLMLAFLIYACLLRLACDLRWPAQKEAQAASSVRGFLRGTLTVAVLTMIWGAFVAGLDAGLLYNTFPKMDAHWFPPETAQFQPIWKAFFAEPATVQFVHRILALLTFAKVIVLAVKLRKTATTMRINRLAAFAAGAVFLQACLGISTLISHVNIALATLHQAGALLLLSVLVILLQQLPEKEISKG